ncbi:hypothetical protein JXQ31_01325 [candidate division KSB1 bacterium]|nr:hypothetical protein [candidate division KSB1 bacterium]
MDRIFSGFVGYMLADTQKRPPPAGFKVPDDKKGEDNMSTISVAPILDVSSDKKVALQEVNIEACLYDLLEKITITQVYKNTDTVNIETIYTFPILLGAELLILNL